MFVNTKSMLIEMDKLLRENFSCSVNGRNNRVLFSDNRLSFVLVKIERIVLDKISRFFFFTLCVTNVLLLENAREQISHLYFFKFFDFVLFIVECVFVVSPFDVAGRRIKSINVADDGTKTLLFVIVY
jgi:hypothetical protein